MTLEEQNVEGRFAGDSWVLETDINLVDAAEEAFEKKLEEAGWSKDEAYGIMLGFREALINAIRHGNREDMSKKVYVEIRADEKEASVTIRDEGEGFNWKELADPREGNGLLKTSGRGVYIIANTLDEFQYSEKGNEVRMTKYKAKDQPRGE